MIYVIDAMVRAKLIRLTERHMLQWSYDLSKA